MHVRGSCGCIWRFIAHLAEGFQEISLDDYSSSPNGISNFRQEARAQPIFQVIYIQSHLSVKAMDRCWMTCLWPLASLRQDVGSCCGEYLLCMLHLFCGQFECITSKFWVTNKMMVLHAWRTAIFLGVIWSRISPGSMCYFSLTIASIVFCLLDESVYVPDKAVLWLCLSLSLPLCP